MKDTLGGQGVQALLNRLKDREEKTKQAETDGKTAENGGTLENYDSEMNGAFNKSQEAAEAAKKEEAKEEDFGSGAAVVFPGDGYDDLLYGYLSDPDTASPEIV